MINETIFEHKKPKKSSKFTMPLILIAIFIIATIAIVFEDTALIIQAIFLLLAISLTAIIFLHQQLLSLYLRGKQVISFSIIDKEDNYTDHISFDSIIKKAFILSSETAFHLIQQPNQIVVMLKLSDPYYIIDKFYSWLFIIIEPTINEITVENWIEQTRRGTALVNVGLFFGEAKNVIREEFFFQKMWKHGAIVTLQPRRK